jgi:uncharacterized membrane protein YgdD (TMEM256/DUF423 family)
MLPRTALALGALLAGIGVALGAYAAHGLEKALAGEAFQANLTDRLAWFETGVRYHLFHALGIVVAGLLAERRPQTRSLRIAPLLMLVGIVLFSGLLYAMALGPANWKMLGAIVPVGGVSFIVAWVLLAVGCLLGKE